MPEGKKIHPEIKAKIHPRNKHRGRYNFDQLKKSCPELIPFVKLNPYGDESVDFSNPNAVIMLNRALLKHFYGIDHWEIPAGYLCPPIPGRADYIHYAADVLGSIRQDKIPSGDRVKVLDIGVGANCIYPMLGNREYGWGFVGSDSDQKAIASAQSIVEQNEVLRGKIDLRLQNNQEHLLKGIIQANEQFDLVLCNPPFHASQAEANAGTMRKLSNLKQKKVQHKVLNFGGQSTELWCKGGEVQFVKRLIAESKEFSSSCLWYTTIVSKQANLQIYYYALQDVDAVEVKTISMGQGNKISRVLAWTFFNKAQQQAWAVEKGWS
ncbi:MAG: 23S rRNA (adenine(1618)-N(6))-methyltransferase RlmF [Prolixibacteraceae bacterium]